MPNPVLARQLIEQAAAACAAAAVLADRHAAYVDRRDKELAPKRLLLDDAHAYVLGQLAPIETAQKDAEEAAKQQNYVSARARQDEALRLIEAARSGHARAERAKVKLEGLATHVEQLTDAKPRKNDAHIGGSVEALDKKLKAAQTALTATPVDLDALDKSATEIERESHTLKARRLLRTGDGGADAVKQQMTALHDLPGGAAALDEIMGSLPRKVDADFVLHALELRFNLKGKGGGATHEGAGAKKVGTRELQRIYNVMVSVPEKHVKDNPRLKTVHRKPSGGSDYADSSGTINLGDGPSAIKIQRPVGSATELPVVDDNCKPENVPTVFFDWNAQHEIAHALDDKKNFMGARAGDPAFGGWTDHGGDVLAVTEAVAAAMAYPGIDKLTLAKYLTGGTEPAPLPGDWAKAKAWADAVRNGNNPWDAGDKCGKAVTAGGFVAGGRVYHEAYHNHWFSYAATARKQGITGYQFRSPGEWFSELYAGYKSNVLKQSHPARTWLDKLFGVKNP
jgi:hypothetical protein